MGNSKYKNLIAQKMINIEQSDTDQNSMHKKQKIK